MFTAAYPYASPPYFRVLIGMLVSPDQMADPVAPMEDLKNLRVNVRCHECNVRWEVVRGWSNAPHRNDWKGSYFTPWSLHLGPAAWPTPSVHRECRDPYHRRPDGIWLATEHQTWDDNCPLRSVWYECTCGYARKVNVRKMAEAIIDASQHGRSDVRAGLDF
jgi:hypothetical protein